jgi:hypothetical protein
MYHIIELCNRGQWWDFKTLILPVFFYYTPLHELSVNTRNERTTKTSSNVI